MIVQNQKIYFQTKEWGHIKRLHNLFSFSNFFIPPLPCEAETNLDSRFTIKVNNAKQCAWCGVHNKIKNKLIYKSTWVLIWNI